MDSFYQSDLKNLNLIQSQQKLLVSEPELIALLQKRDRKGYEILYDKYSAALFGAIIRIVKQTELAEDILSETFIKIANSFHQYDQSKGRLFTWMINIARNQSIDKLRSKDYRGGLITTSIESEYENLRNYNTNIEPSHFDVKTIVSFLKPTHKLLIDLAFFQGYTHKEISSKLQIPLGTVKTKIRKAVSDLRAVYNYYQIGPEYFSLNNT